MYRLSFFGAKWLGRGVNHPSSPRTEVNCEWSHTSTPPTPFIPDILYYGVFFKLENFILDTESKDDKVLGSSVSTVTFLGVFGWVRFEEEQGSPPHSSLLGRL